MRIIYFIAIVLMVSCKPDTEKVGNTSGMEETNSLDQSGTSNVENETESGVNEAADVRDMNNGSVKNTESAKGQTGSAKSPQGTIVSPSSTNFNEEGIPDACDLLSAETIAKYVRQPAESIFLTDGSSKQNKKARACFFKWDGSAIKNAGVMVQVQKNPVVEDVPEYFTYLIAGKKTDGEKDYNGGVDLIYKDWPGFGDDGAYSTDAGKYLWRISNDWAFMIAFNTVLEPKAQKVAAEAFAKEVMKNMTK